MKWYRLLKLSENRSRIATFNKWSQQLTFLLIQSSKTRPTVRLLQALCGRNDVEYPSLARIEHLEHITSFVHYNEWDSDPKISGEIETATSSKGPW